METGRREDLVRSGERERQPVDSIDTMLMDHIYESFAVGGVRRSPRQHLLTTLVIAAHESSVTRLTARQIRPGERSQTAWPPHPKAVLVNPESTPR